MKAITTGQKEQCVTVVKDAARKGAEEALAELEANGTLNGVNVQQILGNKTVAAEVKKFLKRLLSQIAESIQGCLKLISGAETLTLEPTDGTELIAREAMSSMAGLILISKTTVATSKAKRPKRRTSKFTR